MIKAVIFDLDGVISDTQKLHSQVDSDILGRFGVNLSPDEITRLYAGRRATDFYDELLKKKTREYDVKKLIIEKRKRALKFAETSIEAKKGSVKLIKKLYEEGILLAVASSSNINFVNKILRGLHVFRFFNCVIGGNLVEKGKPDPEIFLLAAKKLSVKPMYCVVFEDSIFGMEAAKRAGMKCIGLVESTTETYPTSYLVKSLEDVTMKFLRSL